MQLHTIIGHLENPSTKGRLVRPNIAIIKRSFSAGFWSDSDKTTRQVEVLDQKAYPKMGTFSCTIP